MPSYSNLVYAGGYYGQQSRLAFSVQPFTAIAIDYDKVMLTWAALSNPDGAAFNAVRLVRNQVTFPETQEDGLILWEETELSGPFSISTFIDGFDNLLDNDEHNDSPLISGRFAYYRMWLRKDDNVWYEAGDTAVIVPQDHGATAFAGTSTQTTHDKFMDLIPKVFTTATQSPIDNVDTTSTLYRFLKGFSLTLDELLTYADVLKPNYSGLATPPQVVSLQAQQLGIPLEYSLGLRTMKRLVREAVYLHNNKGTSLGVQTLAESLTGFSPTVTQTKNLMLTMQDSTFYKGIGNWLVNGDGLIQAASNFVPATGITNASDNTYTGKITVNATGLKVLNGVSAPKTRAVPVVGEIDYNFSFYAYFDGDPGVDEASPTATVHWFDYTGALLDTDTDAAVADSANAWTRQTLNATSPEGAAYAAFDISFNLEGTWYVDMVQFALAEEAATPSYEEARGVNVFLAPSKTNYLNNPSFDVLNSDWVIDDFSNDLVDSTFAHAVGLSKMLESVTNTDAASAYTTVTTAALPVGSFYTFSIYAKTTSGEETVSLTITADDGTVLDPVTTSGDDVTLTTAWQRLHVTLYVPNTFGENTAITCTLSGDTTGNTINLDGAQLETSYLPTDYFDGEFPDVYGAMWAGTADESISYLYPNKHVKIPRLIANLAEYMPIGTTYTVSTHAGLEYIGIS